VANRLPVRPLLGTTTEMTAGLVVAGGYSTRFGLDEKPLVEVAGEPMLARVMRALDAISGDVVIDCRADQVEPFRVVLEEVAIEPMFTIDADTDRGPIAGLANGIAAIDDSEVAVVSCDRPGVTPALFDYLRSCRRSEAVAAAVPEIGGFLQPLCGVYRTRSLRAAVDAALRKCERRLCSIPCELSSRVVPEPALRDVADPAAIASVDTPLEARRWSPTMQQECARAGASGATETPRSVAGR